MVSETNHFLRYPIFNSTGALVDAVPCWAFWNGTHRDTSCNLANVTFGKTSVAGLCKEHYQGLLCSQCICETGDNCSYSFNGRCIPCSTIHLASRWWFWVGVSLAIVSSLTFVLLPKTHEYLVWAEIIVFLVFQLVVGLKSVFLVLAVVTM